MFQVEAGVRESGPLAAGKPETAAQLLQDGGGVVGREAHLAVDDQRLARGLHLAEQGEKLVPLRGINVFLDLVHTGILTKRHNRPMPLLSGAPIPPLRGDLEIQPVEHKGERMAVLADALGLEDRPVAIPLVGAIVAAQFDGKSTAADINTRLAAEGMQSTPQAIQDLADDLEKLNLLDTPASREERLKRLAAYKERPDRPFQAQQRGLPPEPLAFAAFLGKYFGDAGGPSFAEGTPPLGVVAPHIDFFRGGDLYAKTYGALARHSPPDVIVALGVAHMSPRSPWVMTRKEYQTPFGPMKVDADLSDKIAAHLWYDAREEEFVHAREHSLEFQALWLKYLWRDKTPAWVPILCSAFEPWCAGKAPSSVENVEKALKAIGGLLAEEEKKGRRVMVVAGVDLAHVGRRFGDDFDIDEAVQKKVEQEDRQGMDKALAGDAEGFFMGGCGEHDWRKVCGLSALYTSIRWINALAGGPARGTLLGYDQKPDPAGGIVSFMGAIYDRKG